MLSFRHRGVTLDYCPRCSGVWLDGGDVQKVFGLATNGDSGGPTDRPVADDSWAQEAVDAFVREAFDALIQGAIGALLSP